MLEIGELFLDYYLKETGTIHQKEEF